MTSYVGCVVTRKPLPQVQLMVPTVVEQPCRSHNTDMHFFISIMFHYKSNGYDMIAD